MSKWEMVKLEDVCKSGSSNIAQKDLKGNDGKFPIYGASGFIKNVDFYKQEKEYVAIVKDGAGVGRTVILPAYSSIISTMQYILPNNDVATNYLYYAILNMDLAKYATGAAIPHIYFKDYKNEQMPLPPLAIQQKIAATLDSASELIKLHKTQLEELDKLVQSVFYEMFGDPVDNEKGWRIATIKDIAIGKLSYGSGAAAIQYDGQTRYVRITDINDEGSLNNDIVSPSEYGEKYILNSGDILFARSGATVGKTFMYSEQYGRCLYAGYLIKLTVDKKVVLPEYVFRHTKSNFYKSFIEKNMKVVAQPNINAQQYSDLLIPVPPLPLQTRFAEIVTNIEAQKQQVQNALDVAQTLFDSLMQKYFED